MSGISVWYDEAGDFLELSRGGEEGHFVDLGDGIFKRVSTDGETIGFAVLNVSSRKHRDLPIDVRFEACPSES